MQKLSQSQLERFTTVQDQLRAAKDEVEAAINNFNAELEHLIHSVNVVVDAYNELVGEANGLRLEIHSAAESYFDNRTEAWQEGDRGQAYSEFKDAWEESLDELEIDEPRLLDEPDFTAIEALEQLPTEVAS